MKIGQTPDAASGINAPAAKRPAQDTEAAGQARTAARAPAAGASVSVSALTRTMEASRKAELGDIDHAKVEQVRAQIAGGTYQVDPEAIADKLLSNAQEMLQPRKKAPDA